MGIRRFLSKKALCIIAGCFCILCLTGVGIFTSYANQNPVPEQGTDGYYLLRTAEDFKWFISMVNKGNSEINVRLCNDLILNDISDWENWADMPPENVCRRYLPQQSGNNPGLCQ